jgi:hypothetical protein
VIRWKLVLMHALAASCEELRARTGNPPLPTNLNETNLIHGKTRSIRDSRILIQYYFYLKVLNLYSRPQPTPNSQIPIKETYAHKIVMFCTVDNVTYKWFVHWHCHAQAHAGITIADIVHSCARSPYFIALFWINTLNYIHIQFYYYYRLIYFSGPKAKIKYSSEPLWRYNARYNNARYNNARYNARYKARYNARYNAQCEYNFI